MPADLKTSGYLKDHIIGMVNKRSGLYLTQQEACLSNRISGMPLPFNMPFKALLECVEGRPLNLWLNPWTDSYRDAMRYQAGLTAAGGVAPLPALPSIYTGGVAPGSRRRLTQ